MAVTFNRDPSMKYTDMCIYIDKHSKYIKNKGEYPYIEAKIFEYIYHICYALALKKGFFQRDFAHYDKFSLYAAGEIYMAIRNKLIHEGEESKGKVIVPIKSCLNFIKAVLFPLKVNYQKMSFSEIINPEVGHDTSRMSYDMSESIRNDYRRSFYEDFAESTQQFPEILHKIIQQTPYRNDKVFCEQLFISCMLTLLNDVTLPNRVKKKLSKKDSANSDQTILNVLEFNESPILWHISQDMSDYVKLLVIKAKKKISEIMSETRYGNDLSDNIVNYIIKSAYSTDLNLDKEC